MNVFSTAGTLEPGTPFAPPRPHPGDSLTASAAVITKKKIREMGKGLNLRPWQADAWELYDLVGEQRFLTRTLANRLGQARFFVGKMPRDMTEEVVPVEEGPAYEAWRDFSTNGVALRNMVIRLALNLFLVGDGYVVGVPRYLIRQRAEERLGPVLVPDPRPESLTLRDFEWQAMSTSEVVIDTTAQTVKLPGYGEAPFDADDLMLLRIYDPHPKDQREPDSPTRAVVPVLRELVSLTMVISSVLDSRLAGAGILFIPESLDQQVRRSTDGEVRDDEVSPFVRSLMAAMLEPISDRSSAAAVVPLVVPAPDEAIEKVRLLTLANGLDPETRVHREESIRRLALGQDCPPELLLGVSSMNHWGAWLVREDVITTHLEPRLALICDAFTTQLLRPALEDLGMGEEESAQYVIWYDVSHLISRPNRGADAKDLHRVGAINDTALRDANGFDDSDAPEARDPAVDLVLEMVKGAPSLASDPGIGSLLEQVRAALSGEQPEEVAPAVEGSGNANTAPVQGPPTEQPDEAVVPE